MGNTLVGRHTVGRLGNHGTSRSSGDAPTRVRVDGATMQAPLYDGERIEMVGQLNGKPVQFTGQVSDIVQQPGVVTFKLSEPDLHTNWSTHSCHWLGRIEQGTPDDPPTCVMTLVEQHRRV